MASSIVTISKNTCHKPPQSTTTKGMAVTDLRWLLTKFDLPVFLLCKTIKTTKIGGSISTKIGNEGDNLAKIGGNNFNQGQVYQPQINQPPTFQAPAYQAPVPPAPGCDFLMEEIDAFLEHDDSIPPGIDSIYDSEGDTVYVEELLSVINSDPNLHPSPVCEIMGNRSQNSCTIDFDGENTNSLFNIREGLYPKIHEVIKQEVIKLLDAGLIYRISDSPWILIDPLDQEKTTFTCPYGTFAYRCMPFGLCNAPGTFQRQILQRCKTTNLVLNWEKCHFMVKEGIVLGHKISKSGIEVDKSKVDVIAKLPHPTTVKDKLNQLNSVAPDGDLPFEIMCEYASDFAVGGQSRASTDIALPDDTLCKQKL
ncbi:hypothetical protein Tco_1315262 [Tanacetum coccineum]